MSENTTMTDTQTNIQAEETPQEIAVATTAPVNSEEPKKILQNREEIIERLKELVQDAENAERSELEQLKHLYYKMRHAEVADAHNAFIEAGGNAEDYRPDPDTLEEEFKAQMSLIREKRAQIYEQQERLKEENLQKKLDLIERLKALAETPEEANRTYETFKQLQAEWKEIKNVPAEKANELWKSYQHYVEQFYDILKLNHEFREFDFKKNLEIKTHLCETAEKLADETDIISAFHQLQQLHTEYRETGPVAKELRDEIWNRFKSASTVINKRHQAHFETIKAQEAENLIKKTALCEKVEGFELDKLQSFSDWDKHTQEIIDIQAEWKNIGFTPKKVNTQIFERFRAACDAFFQKKTDHFKQLKETQSENYTKKQALCEKAESLKDSTDWNATSNTLIQLQKEWKNIGPTSRKNSDLLWKRFNGACNFFFEQKEKATSEQRNEENTNLTLKKEIIAQLESIQANEDSEASQTVRTLMNEWNNIGHVPFRDKDKIYKAYHTVIERLFKELNMTAGRKRLESFKNNLKATAEKEGNNLGRERERLFRTYEAKRNEINTYENNLGFLTSRSQKGNSLMNEMSKKVNHLKDELELLRQKINAIDEELKKDSKNN